MGLAKDGLDATDAAMGRLSSWMSIGRRFSDFLNAWPCRWKIGVGCHGNDVLIEEIELVVEGLGLL